MLYINFIYEYIIKQELQSSSAPSSFMETKFFATQNPCLKCFSLSAAHSTLVLSMISSSRQVLARSASKSFNSLSCKHYDRHSHRPFHLNFHRYQYLSIWFILTRVSISLAFSAITASSRCWAATSCPANSCLVDTAARYLSSLSASSFSNAVSSDRNFLWSCKNTRLFEVE